jgi:asparagine synthase (glutamine-hydrolysing)
MCGFVGIVSRKSNDVNPERIKKMTDVIEYRGPDDSGYWIDGNVGLGHRRLSIIDISAAGHQPMHTEGNEYCLVFNGEIYNHDDLRNSLEDTTPYVGASDTEVLLRQLKESGVNCLQKLNGIFAFAFLDSKSGRIFLARDHFGIKPLYYAQDNDNFYFASEVKSIIEGGFDAKFNKLPAVEFAFSGWTSNEETLVEGVHRLPPGSYLEYDMNNRRFTVNRWYTPKPNWSALKLLSSDKESWKASTKKAIELAVTRQLISDAPVGSFCSGGVDSSLVSAIALQHKKEVTLFNVACPDAPEVDEGPWAQKVAKHLQVDICTYNLNKADFKKSLVHMVYVTEYPLSFLNTVPMYLVSKLARSRGVKVLLSGEGADECFGGYVGQFRQLALARVVQSKHPIIQGFINRGLQIGEKISQKMGYQKVAEENLGIHRVFSGGLGEWANRVQSKSVYESYVNPLDQDIANTLLNQLQSYLLPILHRSDRASMAASIEARVPFLDIDLVEHCLAMPPSLKIGVDGFKPVGKAILKEIACDYLPRDIVYRPKMGFSVPAQYYLDPWPKSWLVDGFVKRAFALSTEHLELWLSKQNNQSAAWLLTFEIWGQLFIDKKTVLEVEADFFH